MKLVKLSRPSKINNLNHTSLGQINLPSLLRPPLNHQQVLLLEQNILRLEVSMREPNPVQKPNGVQYLPKKGLDQRQWETLMVVLLDHLVQGRA